MQITLGLAVPRDLDAAEAEDLAGSEAITADCILCGSGGEEWGAQQVIAVAIGGALSIVLALRALRVVNKYWQPQLTQKERDELLTPKVKLDAIRVELPADGSGFLLQIQGKKPPNFTAKRVRLQVDGEDFWTVSSILK